MERLFQLKYKYERSLLARCSQSWCVCLCSPLQPAPRPDPQSLCSLPPLSSSLGAPPRWPACWPSALLREPRWAGRWTAPRWRRGCWPPWRRRRAEATAASAPWPWAGRGGCQERCTPARSNIMTTFGARPLPGASVKARGAAGSPAQELCVWGEQEEDACCSDQSDLQCLWFVCQTTTRL